MNLLLILLMLLQKKNYYLPLEKRLQNLAAMAVNLLQYSHQELLTILDILKMMFIVMINYSQLHSIIELVQLMLKNVMLNGMQLLVTHVVFVESQLNT